VTLKELRNKALKLCHPDVSKLSDSTVLTQQIKELDPLKISWSEDGNTTNPTAKSRKRHLNRKEKYFRDKREEHLNKLRKEWEQRVKEADTKPKKKSKQSNKEYGNKEEKCDAVLYIGTLTIINVIGIILHLN
jgi:hypothetical protein